MRFEIRPAADFDFYRGLEDVTREPFGLTECLNGDRYTTVLFQEILTIRQEMTGGDLVAEWDGNSLKQRPIIEGEIRRRFGLDQDLNAFKCSVRDDSKLGPVVERLSGLTVFQKSTPFEALVSAITDQQLTVHFATTLKRRLIETYGERIDRGDIRLWNFPSPETLANIEDQDLRPLQYSGSKSRSIVQLAKGVVSGDYPLYEWGGLNDEDLQENLMGIYGVGRWTAEYTALVGYGRSDVIPAADIGLQRAVGILYEMTDRPQESEVRTLAERWRPFRGFATYYIWHEFE
ncbi:MAG: hypothetical protein V3U24_01065 [Candidatus Neomarinimicrobiota bacterium]